MSILGKIFGRRIIVDETRMQDEETTFWVGIPKYAIDIIRERDPAVANFLIRIALVRSDWNVPDPPVKWVRGMWKKWGKGKVQ